MKLEVGKFYRTRDGRKVGPMHLNGKHGFIVEVGDGLAWSCHGSASSDCGMSASHDLIAEWQDEPAISPNEYGRAPLPASTRAHILDTAKEYVTKDRQNTHGKPEDTFGLIAAYWSAHLDTAVTAADVCVMMSLFKLARAKENPQNVENWVDTAGYAACAGELSDVG